ncbi:MAG TPA: hypothetical protein VF131_11795 [Blastocatellia bacterium]|nr:hypothetical protein [Blastocatellia bacterium]
MRTSRSLIGSALVILLAILSFPASLGFISPAELKATQPPSSNPPIEKVVGASIQIGDQSPLLISLSENGDRVIGVVPIQRGRLTTEGEAAAIAVAATPDGDEARIKIVALYTRLDYYRLSLCDLLTVAKGREIAAYTIDSGTELRQPEISGVPEFSVKALKNTSKQVSWKTAAHVAGQTPDGQPTPPPPNCCTCGGLNCCPNPGRCIGCGNCGQCCRNAGGVGSLLE